MWPPRSKAGVDPPGGQVVATGDRNTQAVRGAFVGAVASAMGYAHNHDGIGFAGIQDPIAAGFYAWTGNGTRLWLFACS